MSTLHEVPVHNVSYNFNFVVSFQEEEGTYINKSWPTKTSLCIDKCENILLLLFFFF